jgi:hypothetical protein
MHRFHASELLRCGVFAVPLAIAGCGAGSGDDPSGEIVGTANLRLTSIPTEVRCFQVQVTGDTRTEVRNFDVEEGQSSQSFRLDRLPIGSDTFLGAAFPLACSAIDGSIVPEWISDPVVAAVLRGVVAEVTLVMKRNGLSNVGVGFDDDEVCSADDQPCGAGVDCCSGTCSYGVCTSLACTEESMLDLAANPSCSGFPSPLESDQGWGGGSYPCDLVDGVNAYSTWARGLAFTGGHQDANGGPPYLEPAGVRHAVINFGASRTFQKVVMWWHGAEHTPEFGSLELWDGTSWVAIGDALRSYGTMHADGSDSGYSDSDIYTFAPVTGSKVRYTFDNSGNNILGTYNVHGWLYSMEVFGCPTA